MIFREVRLQCRVKVCGVETLMPGTWLGLKDGEFVKADGDKVPAEMLLWEVGRPGEYCSALRQGVVAWEDMPPVGTILYCGPQRVGLVVAPDAAIMEPKERNGQAKPKGAPRSGG